MKAFILTVILVTFLEFGYSQTISKQVIASAGETFTHPTDNFTMSWTLGETVIGTLTSDDGLISISQGFHTGGPLSGIGINDYVKNSSNINIYPNPCDKTLYLSISESSQKELTYKIFNSQGKIVMANQIKKIDNHVEIDMSQNQPGIYFLVTEYRNGERASFKFVKE
jgi:hypothetical protein